ncbi:alpha/beta fold hydrolase [Salinarimonas ramus]|uniref:Alpha/beta hydrolase n=1 Tax=Salinarimonas ramus TaxID=690164 RepID=A0A917QE32_9HYPH|nr:alpha/beta hydrolase [Salinarimonas ramus]GGK45427.1 alpha/beta hydrolase [Salinarimonas ramus]
MNDTESAAPAAPASTNAADTYASHFVRAGDGLRLHVRVYGGSSAALPVVCLPGLARNAQDFHDLALRLARDPKRPRRVLALDYRGRGLSERDPDPARYDVGVEMQDVLAVLAALDVPHAAFVGTSRGGLITMALAATRPACLRAVVLNDIGPVIDGKGLIRIRGYVGKLPTPKGWPEAVDALKRLQGAQFPGLDEAGWTALARGTWTEREDGTLALSYDPALMKSLEALDLERSPPPLWPLFEALGHLPVLTIRGEHSDILSRETLAEMGERHPRHEAENVSGEGHAPLLRGALADRIADFIAAAEADAGRSRRDPPAAIRAEEPRLPRT